MDGLSDIRSTTPNENHYRRGSFKQGWNDATLRGEEYGVDTLTKLSWQNLGYRLGKLLGETSEALQEEMYDLCVRQQAEKESRAKENG